MLGEQIGEYRGKRTARRVLSVDAGFKVEVSFEDQGRTYGFEGGNVGTYWATNRPDGSLYGEGQGVILTKDGDMATWKGIGIGKFTANGGVSYRGSLCYTTTSTRLSHLNSVTGIFEFEVDRDGNTLSRVWEWK